MGEGKFGQLGHAARVNLSTPTKIQALEGVFIVTAACGWKHSLLLTGAVHLLPPTRVYKYFRQRHCLFVWRLEIWTIRTWLAHQTTAPSYSH
jgi:hypothetical protein